MRTIEQLQETYERARDEYETALTSRLRILGRVVGIGEPVAHAADESLTPYIRYGEPSIVAPLRDKRLSREQKASRKLQGRYLAFSRQLSAKDRAKLSKLAKEGDRETAIASMEKELRARERAKKAKEKEKRLAKVAALAKKETAKKKAARPNSKATTTAKNAARRVARAAKRVLADITPDLALAKDAGAGTVQ